jgi:hypothetical protein
MGHAVIARKVSDGTRSKNGLNTRTALMSGFGTRMLQGKDLLDACHNMIIESQGQREITNQQILLRKIELLLTILKQYKTADNMV